MIFKGSTCEFIYGLSYLEEAEDKNGRQSTNGITITHKTARKYKKRVKIAATVLMLNPTYGHKRFYRIAIPYVLTNILRPFQRLE